ncbi:tyrosine--tRNA ligase [Candidatus Parcubacteria bacterium]|nr:tyrosine--tRNA ligase [Candidatus Parcubacteria bacterium]
MTKDVQELLSRGVDKIYPSREALEEVLETGKKLRLYQGFDPTGDKLHIGHMVGLRKLSDWQNAGHHVIFVIGDGTGQAGDPSGKKTGREKFFTRDELRANATNYVKQASKIVRFDGDNPVEVLFNGDWLNDLKLADFLNIAGNFTWQQLAERDLFQERIKQGSELNMREALYPFLQAYDSVAMDVDLEIGGSDQTFNMLFGRTLMKAMKGKDKFVMTTPLLADASGNKIGKSEGNAIALTDKPGDLYGKMMSLPDEVIVKCFEVLTRIPMAEVVKIDEAMKNGENPMTFKKQLAFQIVSDLNSKEAAEEAANNFLKPGSAEDISIKSGSKLRDLSETLGLSVSELRRLVEAGAIETEAGEKVDSIDTEMKSGVYRVGKHRFVKLTLS